MNAIRSWEADLGRRLGIGGLISFEKTSVAKTLHIPCAVGNHLVDFKVQTNLDPNGTVKRMIHAGWTVGRRRLVCPDCKRKSEQDKADRRREEQLEVAEAPAPDRFAKARSVISPEQRREWGRKGAFAKQANKLARETQIPAAPCPTRASGRVLGQQKMMEATKDRRSEIVAKGNATRRSKKDEPMSQQEPVTATDKARAAKRAAMDWLTEAFNVEKGTYRAGISDATIAKESGLSEQAVSSMREEFFGPLGEPDELRSLRDELALAKATLAALKTAVEAGEEAVVRIERKLAIICQKQGWAVA